MPPTMYRAYSTFTIKAFDDAEHVIEGVASTPNTDRMGDILESEGAKFALPLPLLWQHDSHAPIGRVLSAAVTKAGIHIKAKIEHGILPEIDRAWALIKSGLVRGLSVGFRPREMEPINPKDPWGPTRFLQWEWLELSAVTIPANQDASIQVVRSLCGAAPPGPAPLGRTTTPPAAVGLSRTGAAMPPISEILTAAQADLRVKATRLEELITLQGADGTLDDAQLTEKRELLVQVDALSERVAGYQALERAAAAQASQAYTPPAGPRLVSDGTGLQASHVASTTQLNTPPGIGFARAIICRMVAMKTGNSAIDLAKRYYRDDPRIALFLKEDVPAGSTLDNLWAGSLVYPTNLVSEFIEFLRPQTIIGRITNFTRVPFNVRVGGQTSGASGYWVGQGRGKPLTMFNTTATTLGFYKVANIAAFNEELARFSSPAAETLIRNELAASCQERLDRDFVDPDKALSAGVSPASITNGIANLNATGTALANVDADVGTIMAAFAQRFVTPTHWIMPNTVALQLSLLRTSLGARAFPDITMTGGTFMGLPVVTSQYCILGTPSNNLVVLLAAPEIFLADDGEFTVDVSREASLEMNDAPTMTSGPLGSPTGAVGSVVVSMFQTNSIAVRCERFINWARKRDAAVAWMDDVQWGGVIPS